MSYTQTQTHNPNHWEQDINPYTTEQNLRVLDFCLNKLTPCKKMKGLGEEELGEVQEVARRAPLTNTLKVPKGNIRSFTCLR